MPNQPKTPGTNIRIPIDVKAEAKTRADAEGRTLTDVVVTALTEYNSQKEPPLCGSKQEPSQEQCSP